MLATKTRLIAAAMLSTALFAGAAHAGNVSWSIGIQAPIGPGASIGTVFSNRHVSSVIVAPAPVVFAPAYAPPPLVYAPAPVYYAPPVVYAPRRVVVAPIWVGGRWAQPQPQYRPRHDGWRDGRGHWDHDDRRGPPVHQPQGGRGGDGPR